MMKSRSIETANRSGSYKKNMKRPPNSNLANFKGIGQYVIPGVTGGKRCHRDSRSDLWLMRPYKKSVNDRGRMTRARHSALLRNS
jgi:hypothetical protein